ncbi:MAG TPA: phosphoribosylformylglycinamidine cyclo-ligase [Candidatus Marinimicrobia bacterium]|nr:phosphoribosylformylglycinamidine cyclo-ligase [Candidatus Neomarinimicrobiota bacterium]
MKSSYKESGVDIQAGRDAVTSIKELVKQTYDANVLTDVGSFGGCYELPVSQYQQPVLVASTDGVGTKLMIANLMERYDSVGQCLVNHCVNDILTAGAKPLFFLDYIGLGKMEPPKVAQIVAGLAKACRENHCTLIGGEMAEMPGIYREKDFDLVGTITGVVEKKQLLPRNIQRGDLLIGLTSSGLHTNGYSLARAVLLKKHKVTDFVEELNDILGDVLLRVHRSYYPIVEELLTERDLHGISHITGGGIEGNTVRIIPAGLQLSIDWDAWDWLPIFKYIQQLGNVATEEMREVFNLGIGLILIVAATAREKFSAALREKGENPVILGRIA